MEWGKTYKEIRDYKENWHNWFAWRPIVLDTGRFAWLETVKRQYVMVPFEGYRKDYKL